MIMFVSALLLGGIYSFFTIPIQNLPEFPFPRVTVETLYPGLGAEDIRSVLTITIEDALSSIKGLERMRSISRDGASLTVLDFRWGTDSGAASVLVREAIDAVYPSLPEAASKPAIIPGDPEQEAHFIVAVRSPLGLAFARYLAEYELRSLFRRIDGVGAVMVFGGEREEISIEVDLPRAFSRELPPLALAEIIASETANIPAGNAREGDLELVVVSQGKPETQIELEQLIFPSKHNSFVINDIAALNRTAAKKESIFIVGDSGISGEYAALEIFRRPGADPIKLSRDLRKAAEEAGLTFGRDAHIQIIYDNAASIIPGLQKLFFAVIMGTTAVMIVLLFTLRNIRYSILAGLSLPFSMAASLCALNVLGRSLNTMSLSGIALGIGLVSDTSIIIIELFHRYFEKKDKTSFIEIGKLAASVSFSSLGSAVTTAVVFIPVIFLPGPLGSLFGDLSIALVVSLIAGWVYAQFVLPALFAVFFKKKNTMQRSEKKPDFVSVFYAPILRRCLAKPLHILGITIVFCLAGFLLLVNRPSGFVSADTASEIELVLNFPPGTALDAIAIEASALAENLSVLPGINLVFGQAGSEKEDTVKRSNPDYRRETFIFRCIIKPGIKPDHVLALVNSFLENQSLKQSFEVLTRFPQDKTEKLLGLSSSSLIAVKGRNIEEIENRADLVEHLIQQSGYASIITRNPAGIRQEIRVIPDREASAHAGISTMESARVLYAATEGVYAGELELEGKPIAIKVSAMNRNVDINNDMYTTAFRSLEELPVAIQENGIVFAGSISRFTFRESRIALARLDRSDVLYIESSPQTGKEKNLSNFLGSLLHENKELGINRADESAFSRYRNSLILALVLVLILLYLTMGAGFESLGLPLVLLLAIPFSLAGAGPALLLSGANMDSSAVMALMVLFGLSVNSGMILYELSLEKISLGKDPTKAVFEASVERFRPILTTVLTTIFALFPLVISPLGAKEQSMAAAMLGGISACTALSLFALPLVLIRFLQRRKNKTEQ